jgi:NDP-sugar pyrophosphorylase family protein
MRRELPHEAVILAGGLGTRLQAAVADRPKPLADVSGRPFVVRIFEQLLSWQMRIAVLCVGYKAERVIEAFGARYRGLELRYAREASPLGTGGAMRNALALCAGNDLLVLNGDSYCDLDGPALMRAHLESEAAATMALLQVPDATHAGVVELDEAGFVRRFSDRPARPGEPGLINAGVYVFRREVIASLPVNMALSLEERVFPQMAGHGLRGWRAIGARFIDIGTPATYAQAPGFFSSFEGGR